MTSNLLGMRPPGHDEPEIVIRASEAADRYQEALRNEYRLSGMIYVALRNDEDWKGLAGELSELLAFPSKIEHSFQALYERLSDLSWLDAGHYAILLDISELDRTSKLIFYAMDAIISGAVEHAQKPRVRITVVFFI